MCPGCICCDVKGEEAYVQGASIDGSVVGHVRSGSKNQRLSLQ